MPPKKKQSSEEESLTRIAIVNKDKCKPKKCRQECKKHCPVVRQGKMCIEVTPASKIAFISEELCIGCGICVKKCPFEAINIINLPKNLERDQTHRFGPNSFKLHRLPMPRPGQVLGLVGQNGTGKSTALKVLAGKLKPNLGKFDSPPDWHEILAHFRGSELQTYFSKILENDLKCLIKPQYVDHVPKSVSGKVGDILKSKDQRELYEWIMDEMDLRQVVEREVDVLSGGELQRFTIGVVVVQTADVYMFDEPSSYLDVKQRLRAALTIRSLIREDMNPQSNQTYILVVEHDLAVLDYLSDFICCLYGTPSAYGVVTMPFSVREGINIFLAGFVPTENLRFRDEALTFKIAQTADELGPVDRTATYRYPSMTKTMVPRKPEEGKEEAKAAGVDRRTPPKQPFKLNVEAGAFTGSEIIVMLGENGTGKTTFIRMLAGLLKSDEQEAAERDNDFERAEACRVPELNVSYKPQKISPKFPGTVRELLHKKVREAFLHPQFDSDVMKPLNMADILDNQVTTLSGGELQRVAIALCLGTPADVYLIDEPSAYLDSEQRIACSKVIKRFIMHSKKTAFVVEHDFIMATYLADRVIVYDGQPGVEATAHSATSLLSGMNTFLQQLAITFRRDPSNYRPRINKMDSVKDREQKSAGNFFFMESDDS